MSQNNSISHQLHACITSLRAWRRRRTLVRRTWLWSACSRLDSSIACCAATTCERVRAQGDYPLPPRGGVLVRRTITEYVAGGIPVAYVDAYQVIEIQNMFKVWLITLRVNVHGQWRGMKAQARYARSACAQWKHLLARIHSLHL